MNLYLNNENKLKDTVKNINKKKFRF